MKNLLTALAIFAIVSTATYGYLHNIVDFVRMIGGPITTMFIARVIGIFAPPLGIILGYM